MPIIGTGKNVSQLELASLFGVSVVTVRAWQRKGLPVLEKGGRGKPSIYNTAAVARWREEQAALAASGDTSAMDMDEARRRKTAAEAALAEMDLAIRRGEYVLIEEVGAAVEAEYATIRANFSSMPGDISGDLEHLRASEIEELLANKVSEILNELSADGEYATEGEAQESEIGGSETSTEA